MHKTDFEPILEIAKLRNNQLIDARELYEHLQDKSWCTLRWLGHTNVRLLDGGLAAWSKSQNPLSSESVTPSPTKFVSRVRDEFVITSAEICDAGANIADLNIFDARDLTRFLGENEPIDKVAGHVPGARSLPFPVSMNDDGCWKGVKELQELCLRQLGDDHQAEWITDSGRPIGLGYG